MNKAITIRVISGAIMLVVAILAVSGMNGMFKSNVVRMKEVEKVRNVEIERIRALPELRGVVVSSGRVRAPFPKRDVALYALIQGRRMHLSGPTGGRSSGPSHGPKYDFEDDVVLVGGPGLGLSIEGKSTLLFLILRFSSGGPMGLPIRLGRNGSKGRSSRATCSKGFSTRNMATTTERSWL